MSTSGTISTTGFNTGKVIDHAFRYCRLPAQAITSEMIDYAKDALYLLLSSIANPKPPSWCMQKQLYAMAAGQPVIVMDEGTVEILNLNLRTTSELTPAATTITSTSYSVDFGESLAVNTVKVVWTGTPLLLLFQTSSNNSSWTTVAAEQPGHSSEWTDIIPATSCRYFRITAASTSGIASVYFGASPREVPLGQLNRDSYVAQSDKTFTSRPTTYYFQRNETYPVLHLWPAPNADAESQTLVVWRHRHIMDVGSMTQSLEVPQRWMEAIILGLAARVAAETPIVDLNLVPSLDQKAAIALQAARDGDNDGSPMFIQPNFRGYTR
jgi:hypothetical protein